MKARLSNLEELKREVGADLAAEEAYAALIEETRRELGEELAIAAPADGDEADAYDEIEEAAAGLAADGCDYICALFWMLTAAGFTEVSRGFILSVVALIVREEKHADGCERTDPELAEILGCSERTVQRQRDRYKKESHANSAPFLFIKEGDFDQDLGRNRPTRYKFLLDKEVADAILEARRMTLWGEDSRKALKLSAFRVYDSVEKTRGSIRRRQKKSRHPESEYASALNTILTKVARLAELEQKMEGDRSDEWEEFKRRLDAVKTAPNPRQVAAELKLKSLPGPRGRQNVAPSDDDVSVSNELPSDAPLSEYLRVPSIAREARRVRQSQEGAGYG
jgi:hypothetical protein